MPLLSLSQRLARGVTHSRRFHVAIPCMKCGQVALSVHDAHPANNTPESIRAKVGAGLHQDLLHPLGQLAKRISREFQNGNAAPDGTRFSTFDSLPPIVSVKQNFDDLLTPEDHVSRRSSDTFYVDDQHLLRCHMTAHQTELVRAGHQAFLMMGDVYRRDEIDATHYPVFHQIDGVRVWTRASLPKAAQVSTEATVQFVIDDLRTTLQRMIKGVFGSTEFRWVDAYFPFTEPSYELEILFEQKWLEILGSGMIRHKILQNCNSPDSVGWAFGMGLERLAMVLHGIPDIRLFWSKDERFLKQFASGDLVKFKPYSKYPACYKDITFWLPEPFHENDFFELVREVAGDMVERVECLDKFTHPATHRTSHCYRILYRHMDKNLTNEEVDGYQAHLRHLVQDNLRGQLR
jgi:phenylalanyl-tRNA synthetase alpha chain